MGPMVILGCLFKIPTSVDFEIRLKKVEPEKSQKINEDLGQNFHLGICELNTSKFKPREKSPFMRILIMNQTYPISLSVESAKSFQHQFPQCTVLTKFYSDKSGPTSNDHVEST